MEKSKISAFLEKAGISIVCVLSAAIAFWLSLISLLHTVTVDDIPEGKSIMSSLYYIRQDNESVIYSNDSFFFNIIYLLLSIAAMYILSKKLSSFRLRYKSLFIFLWTFALGTIWVISSQSAPTFDSFQVVNAASEAANGRKGYLLTEYGIKKYMGVLPKLSEYRKQAEIRCAKKNGIEFKESTIFSEC